MDLARGKQQLINCIQKYRSVICIFLVGVSLMLWPSPKEQIVTTSSEETILPDLESELSAVLSQIAGVGKAEVLLTEASGSDTIYQMDTEQRSDDLDTVIITDGNRAEAGLVRQILPPVYRGALVVCQGGDQASVRLSVAEAVKSVTGLSYDSITVLKMK